MTEGGTTPARWRPEPEHLLPVLLDGGRLTCRRSRRERRLSALGPTTESLRSPEVSDPRGEAIAESGGMAKISRWRPRCRSHARDLDRAFVVHQPVEHVGASLADALTRE